MILISLALAADPPQAPDALDWLSGCWEAPLGDGRRMREVWVGPVAGQLVGAAIGELPGGKATWEHLRLARVDGRWTYTASPGGQATTAFPATSAGPEAWVFENPAHDFPQRITYTRASTGFQARVEAREGAGWKGFTLEFSRCPG